MGGYRIALLLSAGLLLPGCGAGPTSAGTPAPYQWNGAALTSQPPAKPDITLTDQTGQAFNLRQRTEGQLTLLYFGYSHCPDACPATMATLALALRRMPPEDRARVDVVFVTTDPKRDTPAVLQAWLAKFDPSFTGLSGTLAETTRAQVLAGLPGGTAVAATPAADGSYTVDHASFVMAYTPADGLAHIVYPGGVSADSEAADFTELVEHGWHT